jgi:hypothetical protein
MRTSGSRDRPLPGKLPGAVGRQLLAAPGRIWTASRPQRQRRLGAAFSLPAAEDDAASGQVVGDPVVVESLNDRFLTPLRAVGIRSFQRTASGVGCTA